MKKATKGPSEKERLQALLDFKILNTPPEASYNDIVTLASTICQTPISFVSLVDADRIWFKAKRGLEVDSANRDDSFCGHAIEGHDLFVVEDALKDSRFADNPYVVGEMKVRFYAGAPLIDKNGQALGALCTIDTRPKVLSEDQRSALAALSRQVMHLLETRKAMAQISEQNDKIRELTASYLESNEKLKENEEYLRKLIDKVPILIGYWDKNLRNVRSNNAYSKAFGKTPEQIKGLHLSELLGDETFKNVRGPADEVLKGRLQTFEVDFKSETPKRSALVNYIPDHGPDGVRGFFAIATDTTYIKELERERREYEAKLVTASKLSSLGEMAGGVAHEINNPLAVISLCASQIVDLVTRSPDRLKDIKKSADKISSTVQRIALIVKGLRTFARHSEGDPHVIVSVKTIVQDALAFCSEKFRNEGIEIQTDFKEDGLVSCIPTQLSQVILNLLNNSYHAVSTLDVKWVKIEIKNNGDQVRFMITDSGSGISKEIQSKIMQPFFTTKPVGEGTGLGLSISKGIVEMFKGRIYYDTECENTRFVVELPNTRESHAQRSA